MEAAKLHLRTGGHPGDAFYLGRRGFPMTGPSSVAPLTKPLLLACLQEGVPHMNAQQFHRLCQDAGFVEPEGR